MFSYIHVISFTTTASRIYILSHIIQKKSYPLTWKLIM